ncbi:MAG: VOC family protein [Nitrososphaerales archaeon]|nr:VOC family protein [Nitrososphaerales archaeon]
MDSVVHFELPAKNPKRASDFYSKAFGWQFNQFPNFEYWMIGTTMSDKNGQPTSPGAINGGMGKKAGPLKAPVVTIRVGDIDKALAKVKELGGKVAAKKSPVGDMGFTAYFTDTEGNVVGLWQDAAR